MHKGCGSRTSKTGNEIDLFAVAKETEEWAFLLNTITGALSFTFAAACFTLVPSAEKLIVSLVSLVFVFVLTISMKERQNRSLTGMRNRKKILDQMPNRLSEHELQLFHINEALDFADKKIFPLTKVSAFTFGFFALVIVMAINAWLFVRAFP